MPKEDGKDEEKYDFESDENQLAKPISFNSWKYDYSSTETKVAHNSGRSNKKGPKKLWVPKDKIIYVANILSTAILRHVLASELWLHVTHDGKRHMFQSLELKPGNIMGFVGDQNE